jgi:hypothetical protein
LSKKVFQAENWFHKGTSSSPLEDLYSQSNDSQEGESCSLPPFIPKEDQSDQPLSKFFVPGWKGDSLLSKEVHKFNVVLNRLHEDTKQNFLCLNNLNRKLKLAIFNEFFSFMEFKAITLTELDDYHKFWHHIKDPESEHRQILDQFINVFTYRVAVIYILKIRFISNLLKHMNQRLDLKSAFYPNSIITTLFRHGSSNELKAKCLESNIYSWYRPSDSASHTISKLIELVDNLNITEIIKNLSLRGESHLEEKAEYSHTISHKNFGLFLNSMLINFPIWINSIEKKHLNSYKIEETQMEVISCKYAGDYLESMSLSHWLAQENNRHIKWDQILCPDFRSNEFDTGHFLKNCHELQFLTFLTNLAHEQGKSCISFVSQVMNGHLKNRKESNTAQKSLLVDDLELTHSTYDRIVLNLSNYPKNNVQHYLIHQVNQQEESLKDNGFIYVLSTKKLFVPSQKNKLDAFLEKYKLEAIINMEELKGKGEIGNFLYILRKRQHNPWEQEEKKQNCYSFRFSGELNSFHKFHEISYQMQQFFINQLGETIPMYQKETPSGCRMEFFQDAVVDGRLIHSSSKDSSKITHPHFFNNLMKACHPFDYYLDIVNIPISENDYFDNDSAFSMGDFVQDRTRYVLIVDQRNKQANLEIINGQSLEAKIYDYGQTQCSYFGIQPKWPNLNLNAVQDFFNTRIGKQIIDLTFNGEMRKVKSNLSKMLLPKFLIIHQELPLHIAQGLSILSLSANEITEQHPSQLKKNFNMIEMLATDLGKNYPTALFNALASFKKELKNCIDRLGVKNSNSINFANPMIKAPLLLTKTHPIYPKNKDIYLEFNNLNNASYLHTPLQKIRKNSKTDSGITSHFLELYSQNEKVITLYSDENMINFLEFLLAKTTQVPLSKILQGVQVPELENLKNIIQSFNSLQKALNEIHDRISPMIESLINRVISSK